MIPLTRRTTSRGIGSTLLSYSRQSLPRPERFLSTTAWRQQSAALASASIPASDDHVLHVKPTNLQNGSQVAGGSERKESMGEFLQRQTSYTILPTPVPADVHDPLNALVFPSTPVQDSLSVIDACLHNCYDVNRAQYVFDRLRSSSSGDGVLQTRVYNMFLEAYLNMARAEFQQDDITEPAKWLRKSWELFESMEDGREKVSPNAATYAIMLKTWLRYIFHLVSECSYMLISIWKASTRHYRRKRQQRALSARCTRLHLESRHPSH